MTVINEARLAHEAAIEHACIQSDWLKKEAYEQEIRDAFNAGLLAVHIESCTKFDERTNTPCSPRWHCETALQYLPKEE